MLSTTGKSIGIASVVAAALTVSVAPAASAKGGNGTRVAGVCSGNSTSFIKARQDDGRIEVEFEVDQNRSGVPWRVTLTRNGKVVFAGARTTSAPSGSFAVARTLAGSTAPLLRVRATRSGESCSASLRAPRVAAPVAATAPAATAPAATAPAATAPAGVKLRGDGTVDDNSVASPVADDHHGGTSGSGSSGDDNGHGADDHGHGGSDD